MFPSEVLEELISYEVASNREDLIAAFQLLYKSYLRAGLVVPCQAELRITRIIFNRRPKWLSPSATTPSFRPSRLLAIANLAFPWKPCIRMKSPN